MTVREIRGHLEEIYGIDVSPDLISTVTDAVLDDVAEWQNRPLESCYPLVFFDAIRAEPSKVPTMRSIVGRSAKGKIRDEGFARNKAVYIALGILADGDPRRASASGSNKRKAERARATACAAGYGIHTSLKNTRISAKVAVFGQSKSSAVSLREVFVSNRPFDGLSP